VSVKSTQQVDQVVISCRNQGLPVLAVGRPHRPVAAATPAWACTQALRQLASSSNTRWCTGLNFCGHRNRVLRADVHDRLREVPGRGGPRTSRPRRRHPQHPGAREGACSENEVTSIPHDVLMVLPSVCALAQHAQPSKPWQDTQDVQVSPRPAGRPPPSPRALVRAGTIVLSPWLARWQSAAAKCPTHCKHVRLT
jgi:hypothetical protein